MTSEYDKLAEAMDLALNEEISEERKNQKINKDLFDIATSSNNKAVQQCFEQLKTLVRLLHGDLLNSKTLDEDRIRKEQIAFHTARMQSYETTKVAQKQSVWYKKDV